METIDKTDSYDSIILGLFLFDSTWKCPQYSKITVISILCISMTALVEHRCAQPRECSFLPKKLMPTNSFFDRLVLGCIRVGKNRAHF